MALFCLLYPSRFLAHCFQPVSCLNNRLSLGEIERKLMERIANGLAGFPAPKIGREDNRWYCLAPLLLDTEELDGDKEQKSFVSDWLDQEEGKALGNDVTQKALARHLQELRRLYEQAVIEQGTFPLGRRPDDLLSVLSDMALASPAVCFSRTFQAYGVDGENIDGFLCSRAAQVFLNRMNTTEATAVVELVCGRSEDAHWKNLLTYCKQGNLQAVLDEYAFLLSNNLDSSSHRVEHLARAMQEGLSLQSASYTADTYPAFCKRMKRESENTTAKKNGISMRTHFAVAFTEGDGQEKNVNRKTAVRNAFNSPFQPFVLATTSIGQEGLDFHNYCRRIVHWNLPSNPIDLEQREGRIQRFACLAIRQNLVRRYGTQTFQEESVWQEMFRRAEQAEKENGSSDLIPYWGLREKADDLVPIERIVPMYPFSKDGLVYERMMKILSLYRLTLGQSRQEELLEYLFSHAECPEQFRKLFMNLSPFYRQKERQKTD